MKKIVFVSLLASLLSGCANHFEAYYTQYKSNSSTNTSHHPVIKQVGSARVEARRLCATGNYSVIGESGFVSTRIEPVSHLQELATKTQSDLVLWDKKMVGQQLVSMPITQYHPPQTYVTSTTGSIYGGSGIYNYNGSSTTTTPDSISTEYVPYQKPIIEYRALFLEKVSPW